MREISGKMGFCTLAAVVVATAIIIAKVPGSAQEDGNSVADLSRNMNQKFLELFERLDRLELKMNSFIEKGGSNTGNLESAEAVSNGTASGGSFEGPLEVTIEPPSEYYETETETQAEEHLNKVSRLEKILSEREFSNILYDHILGKIQNEFYIIQFFLVFQSWLFQLVKGTQPTWLNPLLPLWQTHHKFFHVKPTVRH